MSSAIHVIGDGILDRVLNAFEYAAEKYPDIPVCSGVVHVQLTRPDQLQRMKELGLHAYVQSIFIDYNSHIVRQRVGNLADTSYAFRTMREMGITVSNGTDCPVEWPNPMRGLQCAVTRQPLDASIPPYRPEEAMSVEEALQIYTVDGAYASFEENFKGRIAPGMAADFVILEESPFDVAPQEIHRIRTHATYLGGRCVYQR
jgi:predicted amidohydrolase YtcJ